MNIASTENYSIQILDNQAALFQKNSKEPQTTLPLSRTNILRLVEKILDAETPKTLPNEKALTLTHAAWDMEFQKREQRETLLQSLCSQLETSQGKKPIPFPEKTAQQPPN